MEGACECGLRQVAFLTCPLTNMEVRKKVSDLSFKYCSVFRGVQIYSSLSLGVLAHTQLAVGFQMVTVQEYLGEQSGTCQGSPHGSWKAERM